MPDEEKIILAFIYKRSGKPQLNPTEIYLPLSIELNWFTTKDAQHFIQHCINQNLIKQTSTGLEPLFDIHSINIPTGFTPSKKKYIADHTNHTQKSTPINLHEIIQTISKKQKISFTDLEKKLISHASTKNIHLTTSVLLYAKKHNIPIKYDHKDIELLILQENAE